MKLGSDFLTIARLVMAIVRAILEVLNAGNEEGNGDKVEV
jgi:hypothetical protein